MWKHMRKNRHMRIKLKRWSQQLVLAFSWERKLCGCLTNICEMNALKHSILPSAWRGTWWADCTSKSPKRKRAEQLSCEEWESFYQNQITSKKSTGNGKILTLLAWLTQLWLKKSWHKFLKYQIGTCWKHSQYWERSCQKKLFNSVRIPCVIGSEHSQSLLLLEFCDILDRCASEQMKIIWSAPLS